MQTKLKPLDVFAAINALLFAIVALAWVGRSTWSWPRVANLDEPLAYSLVVTVLAMVGRRVLGSRGAPAGVLVLMQAAILAALIGMLAPFRGGQLDDAVILGVGFGAYVHAFTALAAAALVDRLLQPASRPVPRGVIVGLLAMGLGAGAEMIDYAAFVLHRSSDLGRYRAFGQDLFANAAGMLTYLAASAIVSWRMAAATVACRTQRVKRS